MVYPRKHKRILVIVGVVGKLNKEVLFGDEGKLLVLVAIANVSSRRIGSNSAGQTHS